MLFQSGIDEPTVRRVLDVALRFGQLLLGSPAGTADVTSSIVAVATAYGLPDTQVEITANSITVSVPRGVPGTPVTAMYLVQSRSLDYTRLQLTTDLAQHVVEPRRNRNGCSSSWTPWNGPNIPTHAGWPPWPGQ